MRIERSASDGHALPPGQRLMKEFPRFGVVEFARRPLQTREVRLEFFGALAHSIVLGAADLATLPRHRLRSDFHCAAGWSHGNLDWQGVRFKDVWDAFIARHARLPIGRSLIVLRCQDGFRTSLPLADLLAAEVLLADRLNDAPLPLPHGAPLRLVAPAHYGYKSAKHLMRIGVRDDDGSYRPLLPRFMEHPRARVDLEERGRFLPGWMLRYLFRPFVQPLIRKVRLASEQGERDHPGHR